MIQIDSFVTALKVTRLRRLISQPSCTWSSLSYINMDSLFTKGNNYAGIKANELINPFWKDLLISLNNFCKAVRIETLEDILYCPIWFNSNMNGGQNLYFKEWHDKGIKNVIDLLNGDGNFYQFDELKENYGIHGTFLDYQSILRKLPTYWKTKINQNNFVCKNRKQYVARNCYLKLLCKDKKGSRTLYNIIVGNQDSSPPSQKWVNILGNITQEEWNSYNDTIKNIKEVKLQEFQFKVNNHILVTKSFLHKINKVDNDRCTFCGLETETIIHVLFNCNKVKEFWLAMKNWLRIQANIILHLTIKNVIFSKQENNELLNYILLLGKYFIYKTKFLANSIRLENFIIYLKRKYQNEKYISKIHNKQNKFQAKWSLLSHIMEDTT